jgi:hypothetical protein
MIPIPEWLLIAAAVIAWSLWIGMLIRERYERANVTIDAILTTALDEGPPMSKHHRAQQWTTHAPKLKVKHAAMLPQPCVECGRVVLPTDAWQVGHRQAAALGGQPTMANTGPVHTACNRKAGGRLGAQITNAKRAQSKGIRPW